MVVAVHRLETGVRLLEVPQLDRHVCAAGHQQLAGLVEGDVLHRVCVSLERALVLAGLKVPHLESGVLAGRDHEAEHRVEDDLGDGRPVAREAVLLGRPRDPLAGGALPSGGRALNELLLRLGQLRLQLHHLLLEADDGGPLLLQEAAVLALHLAGHVGVPLEGLQRLHVAIAAKIVGHCLVQLLALTL